MLARVTLLALLCLAPNCGAPCDSDSACALAGQPPDAKLCDGSGYKTCDTSNRGQAVACARSGLRAVCTPSGWSVEPAGPK